MGGDVSRVGRCGVTHQIVLAILRQSYLEVLGLDLKPLDVLLFRASFLGVNVAVSYFGCISRRAWLLFAVLARGMLQAKMTLW